MTFDDYAYQFILKLIDLSKTGTLIIFGILIIRYFLRKAPKKYSYFLWSIAGIRLLCPFSIESIISIFNIEKPITTLVNSNVIQDVLTYTQPHYFENSLHDAALTGFSISEPINGSLYYYFAIWIIGFLISITYTFSTYLDTKDKTKFAIRLEKNIYQSEKIHSPFVIGIFKPKIYIPYHLDEVTQSIILEHENYHIQRKDPLLRMIGNFIVMLHWFNPFVWIGYNIFIQDMEMSCDEHVIEKYQKANKTYSRALLDFAEKEGWSLPKPLYFGEKSVSKRIKNVLKWENPSKKTILIASILFIFTFASFICNPTKQSTLNDLLRKYSIDSITKVEQNINSFNFHSEIDSWMHLYHINQWFSSIKISKFEVEPDLQTISSIYKITDGNEIVVLSFTKNYDYCIVETNNEKTAYRILNQEFTKKVLETYWHSDLNYYASWDPQGESTYNLAEIYIQERKRSIHFDFKEVAFFQVGIAPVHFYGKCDFMINEKQLTLYSQEDSNIFVFDISEKNDKLYLTFNENQSQVESKELKEILKTLIFDNTSK